MSRALRHAVCRSKPTSLLTTDPDHLRSPSVVKIRGDDGKVLIYSIFPRHARESSIIKFSHFQVVSIDIYRIQIERDWALAALVPLTCTCHESMLRIHKAIMKHCKNSNHFQGVGGGGGGGGGFGEMSLHSIQEIYDYGVKS